MRRFLSSILATALIATCVGISTTPAHAIDYKDSTSATPDQKPTGVISKSNSIKGEVLVALTLKKGEKSSLLKKGTLSNDPRIQIKDVIDFGSADTLDVDSTSKKDLKHKKLKIVHIRSNIYDTERLTKALSGYKNVMSISKNYKLKPCSVTGDPLNDEQWAFGGTNFFTEDSYVSKDTTINYTPEEQTVKDKDAPIVAVIDYGVDYTHEDLKNKMWKNPYNKKKLEGLYGYDVVNDDNDPMPNTDDPDEDHGTFVAGLIAAETGNGVGISGVSKNAKIMSLRLFDNQNEASGSIAAELKAFEYIYKAQKLGANVKAVNCSYGLEPTYEKNPEIEEIKKLENAAIKKIGKKGALVVFSAGNESTDIDKAHFSPPHSLDRKYVLLVGASTYTGNCAGFSNYGKKRVDLFAPGANVVSCVPFDELIPQLYDADKKSELCKIYTDFSPDKPMFLTYDEISGKNTGALSVSHSDRDYHGDSGNGSMAVHFNRVRTPSKHAYSLYYDITGYTLDDIEGAYVSFIYSNDHNYKDNWITSSKLITDASSLDLYSINGKTYLRFDMKNSFGENGIIDKLGETWFYDDFTITFPHVDKTRFGRYAIFSGTSFSAPIVTGAIARLATKYPDKDAVSLRKMIMSSVKKLPSLEDKCVAGGTLDIRVNNYE